MPYFCGQCGTTELEEPASSLALGYITRGLALCFTLWLMGHAGIFLWQRSGQAFKAITGFSSPVVWLIEQSARALMFLFVFYVLSMFMPGAAGEQFRGLILKLYIEALRGLSRLLGVVVSLLWQTLISFGGSEGRNAK
jgi:hypothetical protein